MYNTGSIKLWSIYCNSLTLIVSTKQLFYRFVMWALRWRWMCNLFVEHSLSSLEIDDSDECPSGCLLGAQSHQKLYIKRDFEVVKECYPYS